jgi:protease I
MEKNIAMIIARKEFRDEEYIKPREIFENQGFKVSVFSSTLGESKGRFGLVAKVDKLIDELNAKDFDALVFIGGGGASEYFDSPVTIKIAKDFHEGKKVLSAICIAPKILSNAGLLKGIRFCSFPSVKDDIIKEGGIYENKGVVISGKIITSSGPEHATDFAKAIVKMLLS